MNSVEVFVSKLHYITIIEITDINTLEVWWIKSLQPQIDNKILFRKDLKLM